MYYTRVRLLPETFDVANFISHHYNLSIPREMVMVKEGLEGGGGGRRDVANI